MSFPFKCGGWCLGLCVSFQFDDPTSSIIKSFSSWLFLNNDFDSLGPLFLSEIKLLFYILHNILCIILR